MSGVVSPPTTFPFSMNTGPTDDTRACSAGCAWPPGTAAARPITTRTESAIASATSAVPPTWFPCRNLRPRRYNGRRRNRDTSRRRGHVKGSNLRPWDKRTLPVVSAGFGRAENRTQQLSFHQIRRIRVSADLGGPCCLCVARNGVAGQTRGVVICPACGKENPEGFQFCGFCTAPLDGVIAQPHEVRKTVTVVFCDVTGSTDARRVDRSGGVAGVARRDISSG